MSHLLIRGDSRRLALADESVHCCICSPPYWSLRDYGTARWEGGDAGCDHIERSKGNTRGGLAAAANAVDGGCRKQEFRGDNDNGFRGEQYRDLCGKCGARRIDRQLGLESTPEAFVAAMVAVFREVRRVLRSDGTLWLNIGDSYASSGPPGGAGKQNTNLGSFGVLSRSAVDGLKPKDLCGIPWRLALALQQPYVVPCCVSSEVDRAWLAAMFDGEGCIGIRRFDSYRKAKQQVYQDGFVVYTIVTNNDVELLDHCIALTGFGSARIKQRADTTDGRGIVSRRDSYGWRLDGNKAVDVVRAIYPYLIAKRKQACIAYTLDLLNKRGHGSRAVPLEVQEKKVYLKELIGRCNQRELVDLPSWIEEPKQEVEPGWYLRSEIIWAKVNPMPESVTDRPTKSHEQVFLLAKSERYYYDTEAVREAQTGDVRGRTVKTFPKSQDPATRIKSNSSFHMAIEGHKDLGGRNLRSVWSVATEAYPGSHFATFPRKLIEPCVKAGTSERGVCLECGGPWVRRVESESFSRWRERRDDAKRNGYGRKDCGAPVESIVPPRKTTLGWQPSCSHGHDPIPATVFDPFLGSGTTIVVAEALGRRGVGIDLSREYLGMARRRIERPHAVVPRPGREEYHPLFGDDIA